MKRTKFLCLLLSFLLLFSLAGCGDKTPTPGGDPPPPATEEDEADLTITGKPVGIQTLEAGKTYQLGVTSDAPSIGTVVWTSSDETVATVNDSGLLTQVGAGVTRITATAGTLSDNFLFYVKGAITGISFTNKPEDTVFYTGEALSLKYQLLPALTDPCEIEVTCEDENVALFSHNASTQTATATANIVSGSTDIVVRVVGTEFFDKYTFVCAGERPVLQDFDTADGMTYTTSGGTAAVETSGLPEGAVSKKALAFKAEQAADNPGVTFAFDNSAFTAGGLYRLNLKLNLKEMSGTKVAIRLYNATDPTKEYANSYGMEVGKTFTFAGGGLPYANRNFDRLQISLEGNGTIAFSVTDISIQRSPLTGVEITGAPSDNKIDKRTNPKYPLGAKNADAYALVWSTDNKAVATVNAATGVVTPVANGTVTVTVSVVGTTLADSVTLEIYTSDPIIEISNKQSGYHKLTDAPVQLTGLSKNGTKEWSSGDTNVATVSSDGLLTYVGEGETTITLSDGAGNTDSFRLAVYNPTTTVVYDFMTKDTTPSFYGNNGVGAGKITTDDLPEGTVSGKGYNVNASAPSRWPGFRFEFKTEKGQTYKIRLKFNIISTDATATHQIVMKDSSNVIFKQFELTADKVGTYALEAEYTCTYDGPATNQIYAYLREKTNADVSVTLNVTVSDIVVTKI